MRKNLFATTPGIIIVGAVIGLIAVWLQKLGNPANMGICVACFERDVAGRGLACTARPSSSTCALKSWGWCSARWPPPSPRGNSNRAGVPHPSSVLSSA